MQPQEEWLLAFRPVQAVRTTLGISFISFLGTASGASGRYLAASLSYNAMNLLCLAQLHQLLLLFQHVAEASIALGHKVQDQLTAIAPKHAGCCAGETQGLQERKQQSCG